MGVGEGERNTPKTEQIRWEWKRERPAIHKNMEVWSKISPGQEAQEQSNRTRCDC